MSSRFKELGSSLFDYEDVTRSLWYQVFGDELHNTLTNESKAYLNIIKKANETLNRRDSRNNIEGHICLFIRDPFSDRLLLKYSTVPDLNPNSSSMNKNAYADLQTNYDRKKHEFFYHLYDFVSDEIDKRSEKSRKARGLTGWVALTGQPLRINNAATKERLSDIPLDNPDAKHWCYIYGTPLWGNNISEFANKQDNSEWSNRFLSVPIKSICNNSITIGVLRYSCNQNSPELTHIDLSFLEEISRIISVRINIEKIRISLQRDNLLSKEIEKLKLSKDIHSFLSFIGTSLRFNICSLYLFIEGQNKLRLLDACGIKDNVGSLRSRIKDYDNTKNGGGLTWEIFNSPKDIPIYYDSVLDSTNWKGKNTKIFYQNVLMESSMWDKAEHLENQTKLKVFLKGYIIKLIGVPIKDNTKTIGVLKVEFPTTFDAQYDDDDRIFLKECANAVKDELKIFQDFISAKWFENATGEDAREFSCLLLQLIHLKFLDEKGSKTFSEAVDNYYNSHKQEVLDANKAIYINLKTETEKSKIKKILAESPEWLKFASTIIEIFKEILKLQSH